MITTALASFVWLATTTVTLGPPLPLQGKIVARAEAGIPLAVSKLRRTLKACSSLEGADRVRLEIRVVSLDSLNRMRPPRSDLARRGRYLRASPPYPAIIYITNGRDQRLSLAHEWLHHQDELGGKHRRESQVERAAKACLKP